jgi:cytidylate kinase
MFNPATVHAIVTSGGISAPEDVFMGFDSVAAMMPLVIAPLPQILITLDGLSGAGKTTVGRALVRSLHISHLESGYVFKAVTKALLNDPTRPHLDQIQAIAEKLRLVTVASVADMDLDQSEYARLVPVLSGRSEVQPLFYGTVQRLSECLGSAVVTGRSVGCHLSRRPPQMLRVFLRVSPQVGAYRKAMQFEEWESPSQTELATLRRNWEDVWNEVVTMPRNALVIDTDRRSVAEVVAIVEAAVRQKLLMSR